MKNLKNISPDYPRIAHFNKDISNMTHDDILPEEDVKYPIQCFEQEKIDGSCVGVSWYEDGPVLRNRNFILKKGYSKIRTPAKEQFKSAWNWVHNHENDIKEVIKIYGCQVTLYGEWMCFKHSISYDKLPDLFIVYDIWSVEEHKFISPDVYEKILDRTEINYIKSHKRVFNNTSELISASESKSEYKDGIREGIVIKTYTNDFILNMYKIVNKHFIRREDFNESKLVRNKLI